MAAGSRTPHRIKIGDLPHCTLVDQAQSLTNPRDRQQFVHLLKQAKIYGPGTKPLTYIEKNTRGSEPIFPENVFNVPPKVVGLKTDDRLSYRYSFSIGIVYGFWPNNDMNESIVKVYGVCKHSLFTDNTVQLPSITPILIAPP